MGGTSEGAAIATAKIRATNPDHWRKIGALGGSKSRTGGFYVNRELASIAGTLGGSISRRRRKDGTWTQPDSKFIREHRKEFEKNYKRLMAVHEKANRE